MRSLFTACSSVILLIGSSPAGAQQLERAVFTVTAGSDTIAVERTGRGPTTLEGELYLVPQRLRIVYNALLLPDGRVAAIDMRVFRAATDTAPVQSVRVEFHGDSAVVYLPAGEQRVATSEGAVPYINLSTALLEQVLVRSRVLGGDRMNVPVFVLGGGQTATMTVTELAVDSARFDLAGVTFLARVSPEGRLLGAAVPAQGISMTREEGDRMVLLTPPDYSAPAGAPYDAEDVIVRTPAGLSLAGTLTLPSTRPRDGLPAVITISGSGPQDRDSELPMVRGYRPFRQIADTLARRGIATLRLDDRGVGGSDAGPATVTTADLADDVRAAIAYLRARPEVDARRIALVGHSEGGIIAPMVAASDAGIRGIVLMAASASSGREILRYQQRYVVDSVARLTDTARDSALAAFAQSTDSMAAAVPWMRFFLDHEPATVARLVRAPVLILQGATDQQVPASEAELLEQAFRAGGNRDVMVRIFPDVNHLFLHDPSGGFQGYGDLASTAIPDAVLGSLADWLATRLR